MTSKIYISGANAELACSARRIVGFAVRLGVRSGYVRLGFVRVMLGVRG